MLFKHLPVTTSQVIASLALVAGINYIVMRGSKLAASHLRCVDLGACVRAWFGVIECSYRVWGDTV